MTFRYRYGLTSVPSGFHICRCRCVGPPDAFPLLPTYATTCPALTCPEVTA
jgi:hypothetical protein